MEGTEGTEGTEKALTRRNRDTEAIGWDLILGHRRTQLTVLRDSVLSELKLVPFPPYTSHPIKGIHMKRREFLQTIGAVGAVALWRDGAPAVLSNIKFGYAAITWQGKDLKAIEDVSRRWASRGFSSGRPIMTEFGDKPAALKESARRSIA